MSKLIPLNSNEINEVPERYAVIPSVGDYNVTKALEILTGNNLDNTKESVLIEIFEKIDYKLPLKDGKIEIDENLIDFLNAINGQKEAPKNKNIPKPSPSFKKKKDLKNNSTYASI